MRFCTNCGARLGDGDRFCVQCGQERDDWPVQGADQAVQPVPATQAAQFGPSAQVAAPSVAQAGESARSGSGDLASQPTMIDASAMQTIAPPVVPQTAVPQPAVAALPSAVQSGYGASSALPAPQPISGAAGSGNPASGASAPGTKDGKGNKGLIIAIIVAAVVAVALVGALLWVLVIHPRTAAGVGGDAQSSTQTQAGADGQQGGEESKACDQVPDFAIKSHTMHDTDLVVKLTVTASCGTDSALKLDNDAVRLTVKDGDDTYADAVYDFSSDPVSAKAGEDGEATITFVKSQYWFIPDQASWSDLTVTGELDAEAQGGKAGAGNADDVTGADAMDQNEREQVAKAAIDRQIAHDKSAVSDLGDAYTTQLSSKQLNMQAEGKTWSYQDIYQQYVDLRRQWPNALMLWSGDWPTYTDTGTGSYYVIISGEALGSVQSGWNWCSSNGFGPDDCLPIDLQ